jgi:hypothetical protein
VCGDVGRRFTVEYLSQIRTRQRGIHHAILLADGLRSIDVHRQLITTPLESSHWPVCRTHRDGCN